VLLGRQDGDNSVFRVGSELAIDGETVRCNFNQDTAGRPVSIDTVIEAMLAAQSACVYVLANDDSAWNQSQCQELPTNPSGSTREPATDGGCGLAGMGYPSAGAADLTSVGLFAALAVRWRRRACRL
jgi:hypothetical protein